MQTLALVAETQRGPSVPDLVHRLIPVHRKFEFINSTVWFSGLIIGIAFLFFRRKSACINYLRAGAIISILRGIFICITSLGPPEALAKNTPPIMAAFTLEKLNWQMLLQQWIPLDVLWGGSGFSAAWLTQDLFFSGHTSSTLLFLLVLERRDLVWWLYFMLHAIVVFALVMTHEHYSIDILGAYFVAYAICAWLKNRHFWISEEQK
ncbi:MAG TPA: phosphatase PAP2-related protein [Turneriella sp.]|nr:phosphatase PAP2-related protein [Turneriella sp.]